MERTSPTRITTCFAAVALVTATALGPAMLRAAHPPTPPPCAADGACYPKRTTWGYYSTNWRPWPGDKAGIQPTPAAIEDLPETTEDLGGFEMPAPRDETSVGPQAIEKDDAEEPADAGEGAGQGAGQEFEEGLDAIPALDPLGIGQPRPKGILVQPAAAHVDLTPTPASSVTIRADYTPVVESESIDIGQPTPLQVLPTPSPVPGRLEPLPQVDYKNLNSDDPPPPLPSRLRRLASLNVGGLRAVFASRRDQAVEAASYMDSVQRPTPQPVQSAVHLSNPARQ